MLSVLGHCCWDTLRSELDWPEERLTQLRESEQKQTEEIAGALASVAALGVRRVTGQMHHQRAGLPWSMLEPTSADTDPSGTAGVQAKVSVEPVWRTIGRLTAHPVSSTPTDRKQQINDALARVVVSNSCKSRVG